MAEKEFESEDPFTLTGMIMPLSQEQAKIAEEEMAACFIEEYMMMGHDEAHILALFKEPFYQATHAIYRARGEDYVRGLIDKVRRGEPQMQPKEN